MQITVTEAPVSGIKTDALVISLFEGEKELSSPAAEADKMLGGAIRVLVERGDLNGKSNETAVLYPDDSSAVKRVVVVGLGNAKELTAEGCRNAAASALKKSCKLGAESIACTMHPGLIEELTVEGVAQAMVEGMLLGGYRSKNHKSEQLRDMPVLEACIIASPDEKTGAIEDGAAAGRIFADAICVARELVNQPANHMTPSMLADVAQAIAFKDDMRCEVLNEDKLTELGMGAFRGVAKGSKEPPRFIIMEYAGNGESDSKKVPTVVLVGKGITFDSGGISLKPGEHMDEMKSDMAGAAVVISAMQAVSRLSLPIRVVALAPACENLPSASALRPGDVLSAMNKKTIEVSNTDAEGRLILADALCYAARFDPDTVIDVATLTGSCVVALGEDVAAGIFSNDDDLCSNLIAAGKLCGEKLWHLPLYDEYKEKIKSDVADMKNTGGRYGGVGTSAFLLKEFVSYPWAHIDIAGMAFTKTETACTPKGATGFAVRTLLSYLIKRCG